MKTKLSNISKKSKMIAATAFVLGVTAVGGGLVAQADVTASSDANNPMTALVTAIATKFNLSSADVQTVVNDVMTTQRTQMEAKRQQEVTTRLAQAVTDGKLTQAQADLITAKAAELKSTMEANKTAFQNLTQAEREAKMTAERTALKEWATANNIPEEFLRILGPGGMGPGGKGHGGPGTFGADQSALTASPTTTS